MTSSVTELPAPAAAALGDALSPLLAILDAFNHRNKNQHHSSHWWSHFTILRRTLRSLTSPSRRHTVSRAHWLTQRIIPRAYVPFTQLAADNQYAPLGLALLAVLAHAHAVVSKHVPLPDTPPRPATTRPISAGPPDASLDRGVAVLRDTVTAVPAASKTLPRAKGDIATAGSSQSAAGSGGGSKDKPKKKSGSKKRSKKGGDALSSLFESL